MEENFFDLLPNLMFMLQVPIQYCCGAVPVNLMSVKFV